MYKYNDFDEGFIRSRTAQFRGQVERRIDGSLTEDEFKPLRLMNGLYLQLHAYMLRVAIPYGTLNSRQMRQLAFIADKWDKGYGHFTTRQNIQYNWPKLPDVPDILDALADVEMHAIQTSGNTIRNVTADHFAGAAADEIEDPRPYAELLRQWSTDHPEFQFLPRKFKIAVTGASEDRAVVRAHDIGLQLVRNDAGEVGFQVIVGGGLGRTPMVGKVIKDFLPKADLLPYCEAIVSVYNLLGRRDNKYKARIKITVHENGLEKIQELVEERFTAIRAAFSGDASSDQMRVMADLAEKFGHDELRISHEQNVILPHVHKSDLVEICAALRAADLATANIGLVSDIIACPGMDYCALATARSIPIAQEIATRFDELKIEHDIGQLKIKISGCINACGHHHVGHIGILGLDRAGVENYQITLGGDVTGYLDLRTDADETFLQAYRRLGMEPFKTILYPAQDKANAA